MQKNHLIAVVIIALAVIVAGFITWNSYQTERGAAGGADLTSFVQCLAGKGIVFYGAFWCPHCAAQEQELGMSRGQLATAGLYTECSTPDGQSQTQACNEKGIKEYPTWIFPNGTELTGVQTLQTLSDKSQCPLPAGVASTTASSSASSSAP